MLDMIKLSQSLITGKVKCKISQKSNLHYARVVTLRRATSGADHLHGSASGQYTSEKISQRWLAVGDAVSDLTGVEIELQTSLCDSKLKL